MAHRTPKKKEITKKDIIELRRKVNKLEKEIEGMKKDFGKIVEEPRKAIFEAFGMPGALEIGSEYDKFTKVLEEERRKKHAVSEKEE